jgi:hypothetical protein
MNNTERKITRRYPAFAITKNPTRPSMVAVNANAYPSLKDKNPELIRTGKCVCGRRFTEHTFDCITTFLDSRDPKCGCESCHVVN